MPRGGKRAGAGRKSNAEIKTIRALIDQNVQESQWQVIISNLVKYANEGNLRATQLLLTYRYGDPYAEQPPALPQDTPTDENATSQYYIRNKLWRIEVHPVPDLIVNILTEKNCTFDAEGNVIILRHTLYHIPADQIPPFVPRVDSVYARRLEP